MAGIAVSVLEVDRVDGPTVERFWTTLSRMEQAEANRVADRRALVCARALVRLALSAEVPTVAPAAWTFARDDAGKPYVAGPVAPAAAPLFNLSHTAGLVVCAVAPGPSAEPVGVDTESLTNAPAILDTVVQNFAAPEVAALLALAPEARMRRAVELWTVKEAYLKGIGTGISRRLDRFVMTSEPAASAAAFAPASSWRVDEDARWRITTCEHGRFLIAVATIGHPPIVFRDVLPA